MNIKELAEQAGLINILNEHANEYGNGYYIAKDYPELERFAELVAAAEREQCAKHYLGIMRDAMERFAEWVAAAEREKFWDALMSDLEHGVKSLNERASERFAKEYPALNREFNGDKHE